MPYCCILNFVKSLIMQYKLPILTLAFLSLLGIQTKAQTVSDFEDTVLAPNSDFASTLTPDSSYTFQSGNVLFYGASNAWGSYSNFNFSNNTDTSNLGFVFDKTAVTGQGANNSTNYGLCYVQTDYLGPNPQLTIPSGVALQGAAVGKKVSGMYVTNTTYAYYYMQDSAFIAANHYLQLTVRGYLNGAKTIDSVNFMLSDYRNNQNINLKNWAWVDLISLGNVDSLTFDLSSDDMGPFGINVPAYFALDNLTTMDDYCPPVLDLLAQNITENAAQITWTASTTDSFEYALDQSFTDAPTATTSFTNTGVFDATSLTSSTDFVFHIRRICTDSTHSGWDTLSFRTLPPLGINLTKNGDLKLQISPNPANDYLNIQSENEINVIIYNALGQQVLQVNQAKILNISTLASGLYILKAIESKTGKMGTVRFVKK